MQNVISDYMVTYSTFRNNHICFNFQISFTGIWRLQSLDTFPGLLIHQKCVYGRGSAASACSAYFERVWWLQIHSYQLGGANSAPPNHLAEYEGYFDAGEKWKREW